MAVQLEKMTVHQELLLEMLKDFDAVCRRHHISYQLFAGTALGAVRHHGFIPWDDDIDVILIRSEYQRFFDEAAGDFDPEIYYVQQEHGAHWPMPFSKLRRNNTTCIEKYHSRDPQMHQGVYIDIFPCDNLSGHPAAGWLQFAASRAIFAKALYARGYETDSIAKKLFMQFCRLLPRGPLEEFCVCRSGSGSGMVQAFLAGGRKYKKNIFPLLQSTSVGYENVISYIGNEDNIISAYQKLSEKYSLTYPEYWNSTENRNNKRKYQTCNVKFGM